MRKLVGSLVFGLSATGVVVALLGAPATLAQTPTSAADSFTAEIRPIFERSCWNCHGEAAQLSKLDLRTRDAALRGGAKGLAIVPGRSSESRLNRMLAGLDQPRMPEDGATLTLDNKPMRTTKDSKGTNRVVLFSASESPESGTLPFSQRS